MSKEDTIVVFTARSPHSIINDVGSQGWILNPARAKQCTWLVCTQNRHNSDYEFSDATEPHGTAFLLGKISGVRKKEDRNDERWLIMISEYANINIPDAWDHGRNPVRYTSLEKLGINLDEIQFQPMPETDMVSPPQVTQLPGASVPRLTIAEAKKALAATFGVKPEDIEITIRG